MSGGHLVVLDRSGRDGKRFRLSSGAATLGSADGSDIRVMLSTVQPHHATVAVHQAQTVVRNVGDGETLVNGLSVSVAALKHGDIITLGDRSMRWEYSAPSKRHQASPGRAPLLSRVPVRGRGARRGSAGAPSPPRDRALQLAIEMTHRASMPASSGGKQVAIVQPQRRDTNEQAGTSSCSRPPQAKRRSNTDLDSSIDSDAGQRKTRLSPKTVPSNTTKATMWIESRKSSPRRSAPASAAPPRRSISAPAPPRRSVPAPAPPRRSVPAPAPPRRSISAPAPPRRSVPAPAPPRRSVPAPAPPRRSVPAPVPPRRSTSAPAPAGRSTPASAKKRTPLRLTVLRKAQSAHKMRVVKIEAPLTIDHTKQAAIMLMTGHTPKSRLSLNQPKKTPTYVIKKPSPVRKTPGRKSRQGGRGSRETGEGITPKRASTYSQDTRKSKRASGNQSVLEITDTTRGSVATRSSRSPQRSPSLPSPKKSALKDLSKKGNRKTESIKFDLSNLENHQEEEIRFHSEDSLSEDDITLYYSETSNQSPSPRKSINSRSGRMLERLGTTLTMSPSRTLTPHSPSSRKSARGSLLVRRALHGSETTDETSDATVASAFRTRTLSPRTGNMESYSIVDLVSIDSDNSKSVYNSADSTNTTDFATPNTTGRKTRSTMNPTLLGSSTPYVARGRATRSRSGPGPALSARSSTDKRRSKSLSTPENKHVSINSTRLSRASRSRSRINDSDLLLLDDTELEDSSPKTSRRTRTRSDVSETEVGDGASTPESRRSPVEVGTPVLSIQSLLDSSRSSLRSRASVRKGKDPTDRKRKTIGVLSEQRRRSAVKSKSLGATARRTVLRLSKDSSETSDRTDAGAPHPDNEDTVTPTSAVELVPEAVKNKHSTAKKPHSKRSMIDDLNRSDIVKQLFNSPVKRKLSQSMTEFSRRLFDDDDIAIGKRPTRRTVAIMGRSVDEGSERSPAFTPERFVSPIGTPSRSPDLSGIKRLFQKSTPENDLSDVPGLKSVFANSPKNRLSDVRVKEVFEPSPDDDLRRVSGVKSLFQRETRPRDDLTDVRGVKRLFRRSPDNDLRNVSGVKRTLRNSPRNDLRDVRGVRRMYRNNRHKETSHDLSGVEDLFDTSGRSHNAENLFDQMVGKPSIKAIYSKTFSTKLIQKPKPKTRKAKSLHNSLDAITNNVEEWLERELQKRFHRDEPRSKNTSRNVTKELNNLATSTVDGGEPIRASRTRNSSIIKKSASEIYSAHTLPIKKRSLVSTSVEMSKPQLPIKKRAVVHSTPVKGRVSVTMNASELGRVSPIATIDKTHVDHDASTTRSMRQEIIPEESTGRVSKAKTPQKTPSRLSAKPSPEAQASPNKSKVATQSKRKASPKRSPPKRVTRNRKNTTSENNTKKRRTSLVISKKAPVMSPKVDPKKSTETPQKSPKKRATRGRKEQKVETPKRTRVNAQKATVVVPKPSPKLKPQAEGEEKLENKTRRTRKNTAAEVETKSPKESQPRATRGKRAAPNGKENKTDNVERPKRGRKAAAVELEPPVTQRRRGKEPGQEVKTRGKSVTKVESKQEEEKQPKTRGRKVEAQVSVESEPTTRRGRHNTENVNLETQPKTRGKKVATSETAPVESEPRTRGKKVEAQSSVQSEPVTRGRRTKAVDNTVIPETKGRKRKIVAFEEVPAKITKTRGRKAEPANEVKETVKTRAAKDKSEVQAETKTRGSAKKTEVVEDAPAPTKATRGKKAAEPKETPVADKRKRKTKVEASPTKGKKQTSVEAKKARIEPAPARPRSTRRQAQEESAASGRSRRR